MHGFLNSMYSLLIKGKTMGHERGAIVVACMVLLGPVQAWVGAPAKGLLMRRLATATMGSGAPSGAKGRFGILPGPAGAARGEFAGLHVGSRTISTVSVSGDSGLDEAKFKSGEWSMSSRGARVGGGGKVDWRNGGPSRQGRSAGGRGGGRGGGAGRGGRDDVSRENELVDVTTREDVAALVEAGVVVVVLAAGKSRLFYEGNPVVFGGAVRQVVGQEPTEGGAVVAVVDHAGNPMGWGTYNAQSMYRVRMLWLNSIDGNFAASDMNVGQVVGKRIAAAAATRSILMLPQKGVTDAYRLVNGEGDRLGGLVIDVYAGNFVVSSSARWVEAYEAEVRRGIEGLANCDRVWWRRSLDRLRQDGFEAPTAAALERVGAGEASAVSEREENEGVEGVIDIWENGVLFRMDLRSGQKTGHYCDQRDNRRWLGELCGGKTVLDTFCYSGGFSISAAKGGASQVTAVDSSEPALSLARRNMELNGVAESVSFEQADVLEYLVRASKEGKTFDIVILDPPKLAPSRKDLDRAKGKYKKLQKAGLACVAPGGLLVTCTCSSAMAQNDELLPVIRAAASEAGKQVTVVRTSGAAADHPISPAFPEGEYLEAIWLAVS